MAQPPDRLVAFIARVQQARAPTRATRYAGRRGGDAGSVSTWRFSGNFAARFEKSHTLRGALGARLATPVLFAFLCKRMVVVCVWPQTAPRLEHQKSKSSFASVSQ